MMELSAQGWVAEARLPPLQQKPPSPAMHHESIKLGSRLFPEQTTDFSTSVISSKQYLKAVSFFTPYHTAVSSSLLYLLVATTDLRRGSRSITDAHAPVERVRTDF